MNNKEEDLTVSIHTLNEQAQLEEFGDHPHVGYFAGEAEGAFPNGTRIRKSVFIEGDGTPIGSEGTVVSSIEVPEDLRHLNPDAPYAYWVLWDRMPNTPVGIMSHKIEPCD